MVQQKSFASSIFFIILMIIGNFMLLNLFLAILLKSISEIGSKDPEPDDIVANAVLKEESEN